MRLRSNFIMFSFLKQPITPILEENEYPFSITFANVDETQYFDMNIQYQQNEEDFVYEGSFYNQ